MPGESDKDGAREEVKTKIVYITTANFSEARTIGKALLKEKLCACVNIIPNISSMYWWKHSIEEINESVLLCKTFEKRLSKIKKRVKELHSYEVPCIKAINAEELNADYTKWMKEVIK